MKNYFEPDDFYGAWSIDDAAKLANDKLQKLIDASLVVYWSNKEQLIYRERILGATDQARLICIEPIEQKPCVHSVAMSRLGTRGRWELATGLDGRISCGKCGVELIAEWRAK